MPRGVRIALACAVVVFSIVFVVTVGTASLRELPADLSPNVRLHAASAPHPKMVDGQNVFRFDAFGDEQLWTKVLRMHEALPSVSPEMALAVGLKVDVEALPPGIIAALQNAQVDLTDPAVNRVATAQRGGRRHRKSG